MLIIAEKNLARRYWANLIDYFIIFSVSIGYIYIVGKPDYEGIYRVSGAPALLMPFLWFLYFPVAEAIFHQTLGKAAFNLIIISKDGEYASFGQCFLKRITDPLELAFWGIPAVVAITKTEQRTRLGDIFAGTLTVSSTSICKYCKSELTLTAKEALKQKFKCPECGELNEKYLMANTKTND
ncbi:hypothetical protein FNH22_06000 [Fulvivirga sp. M361]|uniref:RDD family protein n=1 Tax=Fulvivirga sp. M361 TaxID=2594266 RepID=UPI00117A0FD1|nr:RDD family protein [Fulvivirga sp. M361]TRX60599.1 hypothetical protein FNH22_06000 [Fulvivirga sp. M361]